MAWEKTFRWVGMSLLVVLLVLGIAGYTVLHSQRIHSYLLAKIQEHASASMGAQVRIRDFQGHLSTLTFDFYGITIRGSEPMSVIPLAHADQLRVRLKVVSLLRKKVDLNEIML